MKKVGYIFTWVSQLFQTQITLTQTALENMKVNMVMVMVMLMVMVMVVAVAMAMAMVMVMAMVVVAMADLEGVGAGGQRVGAGPLEGIFRFEELGVELGGAAQIKATDVEHVIEGEITVLRAVHLRHGIDVANATLQFVEGGRGDEVSLVEQNHVGEADLLYGLIVLIEMLGDVACFAVSVTAGVFLPWPAPSSSIQ